MIRPAWISRYSSGVIVLSVGESAETKELMSKRSRSEFERETAPANHSIGSRPDDSTSVEKTASVLMNHTALRVMAKLANQQEIANCCKDEELA